MSDLRGLSGNGSTSDSYAGGRDTFTEAYSEVAENRFSLSEAGAFAR